MPLNESQMIRKAIDRSGSFFMLVHYYSLSITKRRLVFANLIWTTLESTNLMNYIGYDRSLHTTPTVNRIIENYRMLARDF